MKEENILKILKELRDVESKRKEKRKFEQTIDLIVNLKLFDVKRDSFSLFVRVPHKIKEKKIIGFFEKDSKLIDVVKKTEFGRFKEKKEIKKLIKDYDFFVANAKLMPAVATDFGRVLGPVGKMPSPQLGILPNENENIIKDVLGKINSTVRIRVREPSIKVGVAKESLKDDEIARNILAVYNKILDALPKGKDNVKNVKIKLTMGKPFGVEV